MMQIEFIPLLTELHRIYSLPRSMERFNEYLASMLNADRDDVAFPPLGMVNPMAHKHCLEIVNTLLALDADSVAKNVAAEISAKVVDVAGRFPASVVLLDDLKGGWTNRFSIELTMRQIKPPIELTSRQAKRFWITGVLWSSDKPTVAAVRNAMATAIFRASYVLKHGSAPTLASLLQQEGWVSFMAETLFTPLNADDHAWTKAIVEDLGGQSDTATLIEVLFGDEAASTLGYSGRGLVPFAGLRFAAMEARTRQSVSGIECKGRV
jgi:hypothetical protein